MLYRPWFVMLVASAALCSAGGFGRADFESDLLKKFQNQNRGAADKLRQEAAGLVGQAGSAAPLSERERDLLNRLLARLHDDASLPREDRTSLIRKLQDRLRYGKDVADKSVGEALRPQQTIAKEPASAAAGSPASGNSKLSVLPAATVITSAGTARVPDGGVRVLSSYGSVLEARNEGGVPILGKVPYISRGFRNVGYGRSIGGTQISATVRILSMEEEEARFLGQK